MKNLVTPRLYLVPFKLQLVKAAIIGNTELASLLGVSVLPNWHDEDFFESLPFLTDIMYQYPL